MMIMMRMTTMMTTVVTTMMTVRVPTVLIITAIAIIVFETNPLFSSLFVSLACVVGSRVVLCSVPHHFFTLMRLPTQNLEPFRAKSF